MKPGNVYVDEDGRTVRLVIDIEEGSEFREPHLNVIYRDADRVRDVYLECGDPSGNVYEMLVHTRRRLTEGDSPLEMRLISGPSL
jgi:hypothetical protein